MINKGILIRYLLSEVNGLTKVLGITGVADDAAIASKFAKGSKSIKTLSDYLENVSDLKKLQNDLKAAGHEINFSSLTKDIQTVVDGNASSQKAAATLMKVKKINNAIDSEITAGNLQDLVKGKTKKIKTPKEEPKPTPAVEPKPTPAVEPKPTPTVEPKPSPTDITDAMTEPGVRSLSREQQAYINQLKDGMKSGDPEIAAEATRLYKEIMFPHIAKETSVPVKNQKEIAKRIEEIQKELKGYEGTELQYSKRAKELQKELDSITGTGYGAKLRNWCRNNKKTCLIVGIPLAALTGYGVYKGGQALGIIGTTPTPGPSPTPPAGKGRGCRGGIAKSCPNTELKYGCVGENVKPIQQQLIDCGFPLPKFGVDGKFCAETKAATEAFQRKAGIKVDGVAGTDTQEALKKCNVSPTPEPEQPVEPKLMPVPAEEPSKITGGTIGGGEITENINRFNIIKNRHEKLEQLVFERLVKGCK